MTVDDLLAYCQSTGIELRRNGGQLSVQGPPGTLTPEFLATLREHKPTLLARLAARTARAPMPTTTPTVAALAATPAGTPTAVAGATRAADAVSVLGPSPRYPGGLVVPAAAVELIRQIEARGVRLALDEVGGLVMDPRGRLDADETAAIGRWYWQVVAIVDLLADCAADPPRMSLSNHEVA